MNQKFITVLILTVTLIGFGCSGPTFTPPNRPSSVSVQSIVENYSTPIQVANHKLLVEVVNTDESRAQGLSGRAKLESNQGMLFDFTNSNIKQPSFWMKDMKFDIDIIWIFNGSVIGITPNIPAPTDPSNLPSYGPPGDITHVLEVASGWSAKQKIKIGDKVKL